MLLHLSTPLSGKATCSIPRRQFNLTIPVIKPFRLRNNLRLSLGDAKQSHLNHEQKFGLDEGKATPGPQKEDR
jgi:hypothetical protein